jgi:hypothetical protein
MRANDVVGRAVAIGLLFGGVAGAEDARGRKSPPPEAVAACSGKKDGAACSFTLNETRVTGVCHPGPEGGMACRPNRGTRPPPPPPPPPAEPARPPAPAAPRG